MPTWHTMHHFIIDMGRGGGGEELSELVELSLKTIELWILVYSSQWIKFNIYLQGSHSKSE